MNSSAGSWGTSRSRGRRVRHTLALVAVVALVASGAAACGDEETPATGGADSMDTIAIATVPIAEFSPLWLGMDKGFFADEGIELKPRDYASGAVMVPAAVSGEVAMGMSNVASLMAARNKRLPVKVIAPITRAGTTANEDPIAIVAAQDSSVRSLADLTGKTVAVQGLGTVNDVVAREAISRAGVELTSVRFVEIAWPDQGQALAQGQIDAAATNEPYFTTALNAGHRLLANPFSEMMPGATLTSVFTTDQFLNENKDLVDRFIRAWSKSLSYANDHRDEARAIVTTYSEADPEALAEVRSSGWSPAINMESFRLQSELSVKYELLDAAIDMNDLVYEGANKST